MILSITHSPPIGDTVAVEIPPKVARALGLDEERGWIVVSDHNVDEWPNAGLAPNSGPARSLQLRVHSTGTVRAELTAACLTLIDERNFSPVTILMRPMVEAAVDLTNLMGDPNHIKNMRTTDLVQWEKLLTEGGQGANELLQRLAKEYEIPQQPSSCARKSARISASTNASSAPG